MNRAKAFVFCVAVSASAYTWQVSASYLKTQGVFPSKPLEFLALTFGVGIIAAGIVAIPILYLLHRWRLTGFSVYMIAGSLAMGSVVTVANNFRPLQNPEGFIIGAFAGLLYWVLVLSRSPV